MYLKTKIAEKKAKKMANSNLSAALFDTDFAHSHKGLEYGMRHHSMAKNYSNGSRTSVYFTPKENAEQILQLSPIHINYINEQYGEFDELHLPNNPYANLPFFGRQKKIKPNLHLQRAQSIFDESATDNGNESSSSTRMITDNNVTNDGISESTAMIGDSNSSNEDKNLKDFDFKYQPTKERFISKNGRNNKKEFFYSMQNIYDVEPNRSKYNFLPKLLNDDSNGCESTKKTNTTTTTTSSINLNGNGIVTHVINNADLNGITKENQTVPHDSVVFKNTKSLANVHNYKNSNNSCNLSPIAKINFCTRIQPSSSLPDFSIDEKPV